VKSLTAGFAHTYGPSVRVNCIMAGPFLTDVAKDREMEAFALGAQRHALEQGGEPDEVVGGAPYFASGAPSFTTGAVLRVDDGIP
jgi:NAD(P)-dependent dehydrogenase (short-subunit alcohol dehydrogenase family)